jgi:hypothetical protein
MAAKPATKRTDRPAAQTKPKPKKTRQPPRPTSYGDEISREQLQALNRIVPDDEFSDFKTVSGPAW